jgi:hypothetical protein
MSLLNYDNTSFGLKIYNNDKAYKILNQLIMFGYEITEHYCKYCYTKGSYDGINNYAYLKVFADKFNVSLGCNGEIILSENSERKLKEKLFNCIDVICPEKNVCLKNKLDQKRIGLQYYSNYGRGRNIFNKINSNETTLRKSIANIIKLFAHVSFRTDDFKALTYEDFKDNWSYNNTNPFIPYNKAHTIEGITYQDVYLLYLTLSGKRTQLKNEIKEFVGVEDDIVISSLRESIKSDIENEKEVLIKNVHGEVAQLKEEIFELTKQKYLAALKKFKCNVDILKNKFSKDISDVGYSSPILDQTLNNAIDQLVYFENHKMIDSFSEALSYNSEFGRDCFCDTIRNMNNIS